MKRLILLAAALCLTASSAFAQNSTESVILTLRGDIIDNVCASAQKPSALPAFVRAHTKACATMPACMAGGYSIFVGGKLFKFDKASNAKIVEFLNKPNSKLQVVVEAKKAGDELTLVSITNQ